MIDGIEISGFADEISSDFDVQLTVVNELKLHWISLRAADGKNIADYTPAEVETTLLPRLQRAGVMVSSIGSPIGKVNLNDAAGIDRQCMQLENLCVTANLLGCKYIRVFSFYLPPGRGADDCTQEVVENLRRFLTIAQRHGLILLHENEKEIFGDTACRVKRLLDEMDSPNLKCAFDFANFVQCGEDTRQCWEILCEKVADIHIKDAKADSGAIAVCGRGDGHIAALLQRAIREENYRGFLTLEPHLALFDSLQGLETRDAAQIIGESAAKDGADAYRMQYEALCGILAKI